MVCVVRVDDRLLHGQVICSWVPYTEADRIVIASDEAASDAVAREIMGSCSCSGLDIEVMGVDEAAGNAVAGKFDEARVLLVVADLVDAKRLYDDGMKFATLNVGNVHHEAGGRAIARSVIIDDSDERIIEAFVSLGVKIDIRDVPVCAPTPYVPRRGNGV